VHIIKTYITDEWGSYFESDFDDTDKDKDYQPYPVSNEIYINFSDDDADDSNTDLMKEIF